MNPHARMPPRRLERRILHTLALLALMAALFFGATAHARAAEGLTLGAGLVILDEQGERLTIGADGVTLDGDLTWDATSGAPTFDGTVLDLEHDWTLTTFAPERLVQLDGSPPSSATMHVRGLPTGAYHVTGVLGLNPFTINGAEGSSWDAEAGTQTIQIEPEESTTTSTSSDSTSSSSSSGGGSSSSSVGSGGAFAFTSTSWLESLAPFLLASVVLLLAVSLASGTRNRHNRSDTRATTKKSRRRRSPRK